MATLHHPNSDPPKRHRDPPTRRAKAAEPFGCSVFRRRAFVAAVSFGLLSTLGHADPGLVPLPLQAKLCSKVVKYDRNFMRRAGDRVTILVLVDNGSVESEHAAATLKREFEELKSIAQLPVRVLVAEFRGGAQLRNSVESDRVAVVYLTPGLSDRVQVVAGALSGADVLTVSALADDVKSGVVLGFELVSSQPKIWLSASAAQRQNVVFEPQALKLMKVFP